MHGCFDFLTSSGIIFPEFETYMDLSQRCQSCGMPLGEGFYGTNADGSRQSEYCKFCFASGAFADPSLTVERMIQRSVDHMKRELGFDQEKSEQLARSAIPNLARWK